jgi:hypothetical protein
MTTAYFNQALDEVQSVEFIEDMKACARFTFKLARVVALVLLAFFSWVKDKINSSRQQVSQLSELKLTQVELSETELTVRNVLVDVELGAGNCGGFNVEEQEAIYNKGQETGVDLDKLTEVVDVSKEQVVIDTTELPLSDCKEEQETTDVKLTGAGANSLQLSGVAIASERKLKGMKAGELRELCLANEIVYKNKGQAISELIKLSTGQDTESPF